MQKSIYKSGTVLVDKISGTEHILLVLGDYPGKLPPWNEYLIFNLTENYEVIMTERYLDLYAKQYI